MNQRRHQTTSPRHLNLPGGHAQAGEEYFELSYLMRYISEGHVEQPPDSDTLVDGLRFASSSSDRMAVLLYPAPTPTEVQELAKAWHLHPLLVDDLLHARQRPKLERYGEVLFLVMRSAHYIDEREEVDFAEFHVLVRHDAVAILCQDRKWVDGTAGDLLEQIVNDAADRQERALLASDHLLTLGPEAIVYRLLDVIVDGYPHVLYGIGIDKEQIERQVFSGTPAVAKRIYRLSQEVIDMQHTTASLLEVVESLGRGFGKYMVPEELQTYLQDVSDHLARAHAKTTEYREALSQILTVNSTLVAEHQNEQMKKISGWAAVLFAPTLIAAVYGMNFDMMPELHWALGYPLAIVLMVGFAAGLYAIFKCRKWM